MDRNRDGVVTIDEFIDTCQKVNPTHLTARCRHPTRLSYMRFILWTGWKHNGFHAALWERHLVHVDQWCCIVLPAASMGLKFLQSILSSSNSFDIFQYDWQHFLFFSNKSQRNVWNSPNHLKKECGMAVLSWHSRICDTSSLSDEHECFPSI